MNIPFITFVYDLNCSTVQFFFTCCVSALTSFDLCFDFQQFSECEICIQIAFLFVEQNFVGFIASHISIAGSLCLGSSSCVLGVFFAALFSGHNGNIVFSINGHYSIRCIVAYGLWIECMPC